MQLALVTASRELLQVHKFFTQLVVIANIGSASCKWYNQLQVVQATEIANMIGYDELQMGRAANQVGTLQRVGDTWWSSYFNFICNLIRIFTATYTIRNNIIDEEQLMHKEVC